jgi:hypothetical protein
MQVHVDHVGAKGKDEAELFCVVTAWPIRGSSGKAAGWPFS